MDGKKDKKKGKQEIPSPMPMIKKSSKDISKEPKLQKHKSAKVAGSDDIINNPSPPATRNQLA